MQQPPSSLTDAAPLARVLPMREWSGALDRFFQVPAGRTGVVIYADGQARTFPPGKHRILSMVERMQGKGAGLRAGFVPSAPFNGLCRSEHLLSGDDELLEANLMAAVAVTDPARFFQEQVAPKGELRHAILDLGGPQVDAGYHILKRYAAQDLISGLPTAQLANELRPWLAAELENLGLRLNAIQVISFWRSEDRLMVAEKAHQIAEQLRVLQQPSQAQAVPALMQADQVVVRPVAADPAAPAATATGLPLPPAPAGSTPLTALQDWLATIQLPDFQNLRPRWKLQSLFRKSETAEIKIPPVRRPQRRWWLPGIIWAVFLLLLGYLVTRTTLNLGDAVSPEARFGFITGLWMVILPLVFETVRRMVLKREMIAETIWMLPGATHLDELVRSDRARADRLVRQQCQTELARSVEMLDALTARVYRSGQVEAALELRRLKQTFEEAHTRLLQPTFGAPAYLSNLNVSQAAWNRMLDYDEELLYIANALSEKVNQFQQSGDSLAPEQAVQLQRSLDQLLYYFGGRSLALKTLASQKQNP